MLYLTVSLVAGILLGFVWRGKKHLDFSKATSVVIVVLIFSMGFMIGSNNDLLASMHKIGINAVIIVLLSIFFSVVFVKAANKMVKLG
jgi:uncharacterized membrane protein YbjE (DUF340 family)